MSQTKAVAIFGACVVAAAIGLWVLIQGGDDEAEPPAPAKPAERVRGDQVEAPALAPESSGSGSKPTVTASDTPREPRGSADGPAEYEVGGVKIRDHRAGAQTAVDVPPAIHVPEGRKIPSTLTSEIGQKVRAKVAECAAQIPPEARGERPRVEGLVVIAIKNKQVVVTSSTVQLRNVVGAALEPTKQCIEAGALTVTQPTTEADLASYDVTVSFAL